MKDLSYFPAYDEVHVISDIHMGGKAGFQILREAKRLAGHIGWVARQRPHGTVALVLNGDIFDTLAEDIDGYVAVENAASTVLRIINDPAFAVVWAALAEFVQADGRTLIFVIGNHDIEIAFPTVQRLILSVLAGDDLSKRARIEFSTQGAGLTCRVGSALVYCTHGNEVDAWNYNRYEDLAKVARRLNAGRTLQADEWYPNAGTRMVKDIMNEVKATYKWIDLLKPETSVAIGTLLALDPSQFNKIGRLLPVVGERMEGSRQAEQRLSAEGFRPAGRSRPDELTLSHVLGPRLRADIGAKSVDNTAVDDLLRDAELRLGTPLAYHARHDAPLGTGQLVWDRLTGWIRDVGPDEALRKALQDWLTDDRTFAIDTQDDTYKAVTTHTGPSIDFIVTGHTHLERAIAMGGNRYYFNCGTWIRLLRFTDAMLKDKAAFQPVYALLTTKGADMRLIDAAAFPDAQGKDSPFVLNQTSSVSIKAEAGKVIGRLGHVDGDGTETPREIKKFERV